MTHDGKPDLVAGVLDDPGTDRQQARGVLTNPRFLALFLSQLLTQVGGNMVLYGLTVQVSKLTDTNTAVSILLLTFLVPAVVFGAIAGVFVDRYDRRTILVLTNVARGILFLLLIFLDQQIVALYIITAIVATLTTFFAPAETAMIPLVVRRDQLLTANGLFVLGLQASFALGFAVLGPLMVVLTGVNPLIAIVAGTYLLAGVLCWTLPSAPSVLAGAAGSAVRQAGAAVRATMEQLKEGLVYIRDHRSIFWALAYLTITSSLIGVLGVLGPNFAKTVLGLTPEDFWVLVLPLGAGLVAGIISLNLFGRFAPRKRLIEIGLVILATSLLILGGAQGLSLPSEGLVTLLNVCVLVAFTAGVSYAYVAVPAQTALQEELPEDVRGRVFGVLNTLVSLASFLPIILVGPLADEIGPAIVIMACAVVVGGTAAASWFMAPAMDASGRPAETYHPTDPMTVASQSSSLTAPIRLRYLGLTEGPSPIDYLASSVVPGRAGPAAADAPAAVHGTTASDPAAADAPAAVPGTTASDPAAADGATTAEDAPTTAADQRQP
ncbi:MAG: MFS transporter [Chloroflexi bacterium]|nr:MFS transporter [Chloroflexota bacterium]